MRVVIAVLLSLFVLTPVLGTTPAMAQARTLFELLFGPSEPEAPQQAPAAQQPQRAAPRAPRETTVAVSVPEVDKNDGATRLMVFGDVMAVNLASALSRAFAADPNLIIISKGVGSTGFVRDDFYDWNAALAEEIRANSFDMAVVSIGSNDRQPINGAQPLSEEWKASYLERLNRFLGQLRAVGKPVVWVGLPPMRAESYSAALSEISSLHRLASISNGSEFADIYERFTDETGNYTDRGPDLNGQDVLMRRDDGIHFTNAGSDKVAFYVSQAMRVYYRGGAATIEISDPLEGTDAQVMVRLPFQGNGQVRLLEVAGAVLPLTTDPRRSAELVTASPELEAVEPFTLKDLVSAPAGRADAFGVGYVPDTETNRESPNPSGL